jgi:hypothetical protein
MKKILLTAAGLVLAGALAHNADAAAVTIGTADVGNCYPFMCNDSGTNTGPSITYQQVYSAGAFSGPLSISAETFYWFFAQTYGGTDTLLGGTYAFTLSTTSAPVDGLDSSCLSCNLGADATQVLTYSVPAGGLSFPASYTLVNTTPFDYDPANGNLLLQVAVTNQDDVPNYSGNSYVDADDTGALTSRAYAFAGSNSGFADSTGLVTTFSSGPISVPEPSPLSLMAGGLLLLIGVARVRGQRA